MRDLKPVELTERQIEDVFAVHADLLIEPGLTLEARQAVLPGSRLRADLLFLDRNGRRVLLELKRGSASREDVGQVIEYAGVLKECRVILAAPHFAASLKTAFEHYGIGYIEFSMVQMAKLYDLLPRSRNPRGGSARPEAPKVAALAREVVSEPLASRQLRDGNIAFKVAFNDQNWSRVCTPDAFRFNVVEKKVPWCVLQASEEDNCQSARYRGKLLPLAKAPCSPCYDAAALAMLTFSPCWNHGSNPRPYTCLEAKVGKLALLTSRLPGEDEDQRFVFAILHVARIDTRADGEESYHGDPETSIVLEPAGYVKFWDHYSNPRSPGVVMWGSGLFRYVNDTIIRSVLDVITATPGGAEGQRRRAQTLRARY